MKIEIKSWRPDIATQMLVHKANEILEDFDNQGFRLTLRQLYYQFIALDYFPNTESSYSRLGKIVTRAREAGMIDWDHIADRHRTAYVRKDDGTPGTFITSVAHAYTLDYWKGQNTRVEVWVEKDALRDIVEQACSPYGVTTFSNKGYCSASAMFEAAQRFYDFDEKYVERIVVLHLGDHDPSGVDMSRDIEQRLIDYRNGIAADNGYADERAIEVDRIAMTMEQIKQFSCPPNPAKMSDSRAKKYVRKYGRKSWELDAIPPAELVYIIQTAIERYVNNKEMFDYRIRKEKDGIARILDIGVEERVQEDRRKRP